MLTHEQLQSLLQNAEWRWNGDETRPTFWAYVCDELYHIRLFWFAIYVCDRKDQLVQHVGYRLFRPSTWWVRTLWKRLRQEFRHKSAMAERRNQELRDQQQAERQAELAQRIQEGCK